MAYIQRKTPPPNKVHTFSLTNFVGGLNNRSEVLQPNQCSDVLNMIFADDTVMEKRRGSTIVDTLTLNGELTFIDEYKPYNDTDVLIRATKTEIYVGNMKVANINGQITGVNFAGKYFFADGEKFYVWGKFPQTSTTYEEVIGTPDANYLLMEVVNPPQGFTPLGTEHTRGKVKYDYTNRKVWYEPCQNEIEDPYKKSNVLPQNPRYIIVHNGRLFISGSKKDNDNVFISDLNNPYYFPVSLPMQLPPNSDKVVGLHVYDNSVVVGREEDIYVITGMTNRTDMGVPVFRLQKVNTHTGFANHYAVNVAHNYLFFMGSDGNAYALASVQGNERALASSILSRTVDFFRPPVNLTKQDIYEASSIFFDDKWYITMKDKIMIYSYRHQAWTMYNNLHARSFYKFNNILFWGNKDGQLCMPSEDYLDQGKPYEAYWTSKNFDMDDANAYKQFREFFIIAHTYENVTSDIRLTFDVDYVDIKSKVLIKNEVSVWGRARWGDRFIARNINASLPFTIGRRGRSIRFTFRNGYFPSTPVQTFSELQGYLGKKEGTLVYVQDEGKYYLFEDGVWTPKTIDELNQGMKIYQVNGDYEYRGKR